MVAHERIETMTLPALKSLWHATAQELAVLADWIAYQKAGSDQIQLVSRR